MAYMQALDLEASCPECLVPFVDGGEEMVCPKCGRVRSKQCEDAPPSKTVEHRALGKPQLGSFMGTMRITAQERASKGIAGSNSKYEYLKRLSDFAGRNEGSGEACDRIIDRVGEKLYLPRVVLDEASAVARAVLSSNQCHRRVTVAALSAFSLVTACRVEEITSVSVREIISAHAALGRRVNSSSFIQLALESPIKILPRRPEDYISRVLARLSWDKRLAEKLRSEGASQTSYFNALRETAKELLSEVRPDELSGRRPCALAAAAIYSAEVALATRESRRKRLTQRLLAECGDAAEYTIREQCASIFTPAANSLMTRSQRESPAATQR
jgi:transcription initiation factor TFIIIB Brf1 subunit/transcription initiation factor TFIIB